MQYLSAHKKRPYLPTNNIAVNWIFEKIIRWKPELSHSCNGLHEGVGKASHAPRGDKSHAYDVSPLNVTLSQFHWNGHVVILTKLPSLAALKVLNLTSSGTPDVTITMSHSPWVPKFEKVWQVYWRKTQYRPHRGIGMVQYQNNKRMNDSLNMKKIQHSMKRTKHYNNTLCNSRDGICIQYIYIYIHKHSFNYLNINA